MTIQNDMSQKDREHERELVLKKFSKNAEAAGNCHYVIRGPPGERKLIKPVLKNAQLQIKNLKVMYTNCDTLSIKFEELEIAVKIENPSAIILVEVAPKNARYQLQKSELELEGYQLFINDYTKKMLEV